MPLAAQALLPFVALLAAAVMVRRRPRHPVNGWIACGGTGVAALIALVELLRLSPGEHVDVPYLTTFPYADLAIRLDGLSLAFATVTLMTAALLMLARQQSRGDRRDPWFGWLLTSAAACAVVLSDNLLLLYIALQVLTLAWSGALDETAPRRRGLRLLVQVADIGLLLAAASAIQSVGTSAFSGVPSDTFGLATFVLVLAPVAARIGVLAWASGGRPASVSFEPAVAWMAPAGYVLLRLLALMGGRLPDRPTAVVMFGVAALAAAGLAAVALSRRAGPQLAALLLAAQAALAVALSAGSEPLMTVASTWLWLLLVPLAGLTGLAVKSRSLPEALILVNLAILPGSIAFLGAWLAGLALNAAGLPIGILPVAIVVLACTAAALTRAAPRMAMSLDLATVWGSALLLIAAFPLTVMNPLVLPAAATVRSVPTGTISASPFGLGTSFGLWPALPVSLAVAALLGLVALRRPHLPLRTAISSPGRWLTPNIPAMGRPRIPTWSRLVLWAGLFLVVGVALVWP